MSEIIENETGSAVDGLQGRLSNLEDRFEVEERSFIKKFGAWGGIIALIISCLVGGLDVYDRLISSPKEAFAQKIARLGEISQQMRNHTIEQNRLMSEQRFAELQSYVPLAAAEKVSLLSEVETFEPNVIRGLDTATLTTFSWENLSFGNIKQARKFAEAAKENATSDIMEAEALRYLGMTYFAPGPDQDITAARNTYSSARALLDKSENMNVNMVKAGLYQAWIPMEARNGKCEYASGLFEEFKVLSEQAFKQNGGVFDPILAKNSLFFNSPCAASAN